MYNKNICSIQLQFQISMFGNTDIVLTYMITPLATDAPLTPPLPDWSEYFCPVYNLSRFKDNDKKILFCRRRKNETQAAERERRS